MTVFEYLRLHEDKEAIAERIVAFVPFSSGRLMLATNHNVYEIRDGKIAPIQVIEKTG